MNENKSIRLEELLKNKWIPSGILPNNQMILGKCGEKIIYNLEKEEIIVKYSTEIRR